MDSNMCVCIHLWSLASLTDSNTRIQVPHCCLRDFWNGCGGIVSDRRSLCLDTIMAIHKQSGDRRIPFDHQRPRESLVSSLASWLIQIEAAAAKSPSVYSNSTTMSVHRAFGSLHTTIICHPLCLVSTEWLVTFDFGPNGPNSFTRMYWHLLNGPRILHLCLQMPCCRFLWLPSCALWRLFSDVY